MTYAVIQTGGKQYKVSVGDEILIDRLNIEKGKEYSFPEVLLIRSDNKTVIGNPYVTGGKVAGKVLDHIKGDKIRVAKFKAKVRYRRVIGFRPFYSRVLIEKIELSEEKKRKKASRLTPVKK